MNPSPIPFPPHWFTVYRSGTVIGATLQPANCLVQATSWRLYPESLRTSDLVAVFESLAKEPANCSLVVCYVDSIDSAHYLMESARVALAAFDDKTRDRLFGPPVVPPTEADQPKPALPPGHPDSFSMDELRKTLGVEPEQPQIAKAPPMLKDLDDYAWKEAFGYAGEPDTCGKPDVRECFPGCKVSLSPFTRMDVAEILASVEGENDGPPWRMAGRLHDGRWFYLEAGCDYTGWDCQASGSVTMAENKADCIRFAMTQDARNLFGIILK